jgi:hypothetical protein
MYKSLNLFQALQELSELVNNSKVDDVLLVLPSWAHFYKILTVDTDCKVREITQVSNTNSYEEINHRLK